MFLVKKIEATLLFAMIVLPLQVLISCATTDVSGSQSAETVEKKKHSSSTHFADGTKILNSADEFSEKDALLVTFAGDLMAHTPNWAKGDFPRIYKDIEGFVQKSPLSFANLETPVAASKPYSTYPAFNVHGEYAQAAIDAGFNVFSLANNHTNDQGLTGIQETKQYFDKVREQTKSSSRPVYAAGLKESKDGNWTYQEIQSGSWKILFVAITEILNSPSYSSYIDFLLPTEAKRAQFVKDMKTLREEHPCDLFVISVHCSEPEYVFKISKSEKDFYYNLLEESEADVIWCNHPHVSKIWEVVTDKENVPRKMIFYSMGNTISAQRTSPKFNAPETNRDYTGDGYITQVQFERGKDGKISIKKVDPVIVTTYIAPDGFYEIRMLTDSLIQNLKDSGFKKWGEYLAERKKLMEKIQGTTVWQ